MRDGRRDGRMFSERKGWRGARDRRQQSGPDLRCVRAPPHRRRERWYRYRIAMCERIVECHGGDIWAESEVGEGMRFELTVPES